jgi:hypothetical protein
MSTEKKEKGYRLTPVESTPAARNSWTDDRGNRHTFISYDEGSGDERVNIQIHVEQIGSYCNIRVEEWDGNEPNLLRMGTGGIDLKRH